MLRLLMPLLILMTATTAVQAACFQDNQKVILEGTLSQKTIKLDPKDFGWVPADGRVTYTALTVATPFCLDADGMRSEIQRTVQVGFNEQTSEQAKSLPAGTRVLVSGNLFQAHTSHHFEHTVLIVEAIKTVNR